MIFMYFMYILYIDKADQMLEILVRKIIFKVVNIGNMSL